MSIAMRATPRATPTPTPTLTAVLEAPDVDFKIVLEVDWAEAAAGEEFPAEADVTDAGAVEEVGEGCDDAEDVVDELAPGVE